MLLAASACGRSAIDSVYVNIPDLDGLAAEADDAAASGFALKGYGRHFVHSSSSGLEQPDGTSQDSRRK